MLHPNSSRYLSPDDLASLNLSIPSLSLKVILESISSVFWYIQATILVTLFILNFDCCQDQSEASSLTETSKVSLGDKEPKEDIEAAVDEVTEDKTSADDFDLAESGKKDPFVRRQVLLIKSGLADVG